jgi:hypothetical protein
MSLLIFQRIAEERIREAMENGDFKDLEFKGKPLELKEDPFMPEDLRVVYKVLKNAGFLPKEVELRKEISRLEEMLEDEVAGAYSKVRKLNALIFHLNQIRRTPLNIQDEYYSKIAQKIKLAREEKKKESSKINWSRLQTFLYISALRPRRR